MENSSRIALDEEVNDHDGIFYLSGLLEIDIDSTWVGSERCKVDDVKLMNLESSMGPRARIEDGDIPEWLLVEVLVKLPAKLVIRFKLVAKQWLSVISDPSFRREYISRAPMSSQSWTFVSHILHHESSPVSYFPVYMLLEDVCTQVAESNFCVLPLPRKQQPCVGKFYLISGVSCGLVLYSLFVQRGDVNSYYICNPVTGQWVSLPPPTHAFHTGRCGFDTRVEDGVLKRYRVVRVDKQPRSNILRFDVFISEIGEWKIFTVSSDLNISLSMWKESTALNGVLHWVAPEHGIIAYDPYESPERIRIIAFPSDRMDQEKQGTSLCAAYQGKLRYFEVSKEFSSYKLWILHNYSSDDWSLLHKVNYKTVCFRPLSFHPFDGDSVYLVYNDLLLLYNFRTEILEIVHTCSSKSPLALMPQRRCVFLLMIPPWPLSIPCPFSRASEG